MLSDKTKEIIIKLLKHEYTYRHIWGISQSVTPNISDEELRNALEEIVDEEAE
jgi:hypothetical protein